MEKLNCKKDRIYLTGFMGTGKSTVGAYLSRITSRRIIDTDSIIEKESGISIAEIFKSHDETYFRELERSVLISTFQLKNVIISTGGGLPCYEDNMKLINANGISVCLMARPDVILSRLSFEKKVRPLAAAWRGQNGKIKFTYAKKSVLLYISRYISRYIR